MKIAVIVLVCLTAILAVVLAMWFRSSRTDPRLEGTWRSNKEETVARWRQEGIIPANIIEGFEKQLLGKIIATYSGRTLTNKSTFDDWIETTEFRIIESGEDYVIGESFTKVHNRVLRWKVRFVENGFWISNDELLEGYTEKFDRINP